MGRAGDGGCIRALQLAGPDTLCYLRILAAAWVGQLTPAGDDLPARFDALQKLDELGQELEHLTAGLPFTSAANGGGAGVASDAAAPEVGNGSQVDATVAAPAPPPDALSEGQQKGQPRAGHAGAEGADAAGDAALQEQHAVAEEQQRRQEEAERLRRRLAEQQKAAADARSRHVQLGGRRPGPSLIPPAPAGNNGSPAGPFRGFD